MLAQIGLQLVSIQGGASPMTALLAMVPEVDEASLIQVGVFLSLMSIYVTSKLGRKFSKRLNLLPVRETLVGTKADLSILTSTTAENRTGFVITAFLSTVANLGRVIIGWAVFGPNEVNRSCNWPFRARTVLIRLTESPASSGRWHYSPLRTNQR